MTNEEAEAVADRAYAAQEAARRVRLTDIWRKPATTDEAEKRSSAEAALRRNTEMRVEAQRLRHSLEADVAAVDHELRRLDEEAKKLSEEVADGR